MVAITQASIRSGRDGLSIEETLTLADLKAAINAMKDVEASMGAADKEVLRRVANAETSEPANLNAAE